MDHQQLIEAPKEKPVVRKQVDAPVHEDAKRKNIPTAEYESVMAKEDHTPIELAYQRRNRDLDPPCGIKFNSNFQWSTTSRDALTADGTLAPAFVGVLKEPVMVGVLDEAHRRSVKRSGWSGCSES